MNETLLDLGLNLGLNTVGLGLVAIAPKKLLTRAGIVHAWFLGVVTWACLGWPGYAIVGVYFVLGSAVTRLGAARKEAAGIAEKRGGARGPENVWGSAAASAVCALAIGAIEVSLPTDLAHPWLRLLTIGYVAGYSAKLADTFASEVGKAYGQKTFSIISLRPVAPGTEGAVSLEGTLAGAIGGLILALVGVLVGLVPVWAAVICAIAAFLAMMLESAIGAMFQENYDWLTNEVVNAIETFLGAGLAIGLASLVTQVLHRP